MSGWTNEMFNNNLPPLTLDQTSLLVQVQTWLAKLFLLGQPIPHFVQVGEMFPHVNYEDLVQVWDDFQRSGFSGEVRVRYSLGGADTGDLSDEEEE